MRIMMQWLGLWIKSRRMSYLYLLLPRNINASVIRFSEFTNKVWCLQVKHMYSNSLFTYQRCQFHYLSHLPNWSSVLPFRFILDCYGITRLTFNNLKTRFLLLTTRSQPLFKIFYFGICRVKSPHVFPPRMLTDLYHWHFNALD